MKLAHSSLYSFPPSIPSKSRYNYSITEVLIARFFFCVCVCVCVWVTGQSLYSGRTVTLLRPSVKPPNVPTSLTTAIGFSCTTGQATAHRAHLLTTPLHHSWARKKHAGATSLSRGLRANGTYFLSLRNRCQCGSHTCTIPCALRSYSLCV